MTHFFQSIQQQDQAKASVEELSLEYEVESPLYIVLMETSVNRMNTNK